MTELDLDALEAVALTATQSEWDIQWETDEHNAGMPEHYAECLLGPHIEGWPGIDSMSDLEVGDAAHIAAFDPPTVLALIARLREAEAALGAIRSMLPPPMSEPLARDFAGRPFPRTIDGDRVDAILSRYKPTNQEGEQT